ncbi:monovalent cation:proton antiporter-2 (CPA2) family protein [Marinobacterium aestuariivivens]|uniref:Monovalent cation:proton antiporter-2 (CPA2) family protein n=1 Tax=Marinobacterium aestuariivivens TaxID=1698799 RepID=A0ABW2AA01_9GAMM
MEPILTVQLVVVLALATVAVALFQQLGLSSILGYLATGVVVGPAVLDWLPDAAGYHRLAELGVVLLMFTIGLEFSLPRLWAAKRLVLGFGSAQMALTALLFGIVAWWGWRLGAGEAFVVGMALAMSSTAIVLKQLSEQLELPTPHGRVATGILLFQDLATVPMLAVLPVLAAEPERLAEQLVFSLGKAALVFAGLVLIGRRLLPPVLHWVAAKRSLELFMLTALLLALAAAALSDLAGLSPTLGAFMAGMLLGETLFRHQVEADIRPFRDLMLGVFFATIGMQLDPGVYTRTPETVALLLLALFVAKALLLVPLVRVFGQPASVARRAAILLAHGGEFGLLLLSSALAAGLLEPHRAQPLLAAVILSMAVAPLQVRFNNRLAQWLGVGRTGARYQDNEAHIAEVSSSFSGHVIVCGYGRFGQNLLHLLTEEGIAALALDLDPERVRQAAAAGEPVLFGNVLQPGILRAAGLERARALAVTVDDATLATRIVAHVRHLRGDLPLLVRSRRGRDDKALEEAGALVFPEGLEASLAFAGQLLIMLGLSPARVEARLNAVRANDYAPLRTFIHDSADPGGEADASDFPVQTRAVVIAEGHHAAGRTPEELDFAGDGIELVDVRRGALRVPGPLLDTQLRPGDVLLISGEREALERVTARLMEGA